MLSTLRRNHETFMQYLQVSGFRNHGIACRTFEPSVQNRILSRAKAPGSMRLQNTGRNRKNHKSQTSMEMLSFFLIALLMFSITYTLVFDKTQDAYDSKTRKIALEAAEKIASEINTAVSEGDGYLKNITLPENIFGANYNVSIDRGNVIITWREKNAAARTTVNNITGHFSSGNNLIANKGGIIFVSHWGY